MAVAGKKFHHGEFQVGGGMGQRDIGSEGGGEHIGDLEGEGPVVPALLYPNPLLGPIHLHGST